MRLYCHGCQILKKKTKNLHIKKFFIQLNTRTNKRKGLRIKKHLLTVCGDTFFLKEKKLQFRKGERKARKYIRRQQMITLMVLIFDGDSEIGAHVKEQSLLFDLFKAFD